MQQERYGVITDEDSFLEGMARSENLRGRDWTLMAQENITDRPASWHGRARVWRAGRKSLRDPHQSDWCPTDCARILDY
jgi:hypothetical protein